MMNQVIMVKEDGTAMRLLTMIKKREYENEHEDEKRCELFEDHKLLVCNVRRFEIVKYSFRQDKEYVAVNEDEYEDLTSTNIATCLVKACKVWDDWEVDVAGKLTQANDDVIEHACIFRRYGHVCMSQLPCWVITIGES
uniref:Uncharacterized protein n=1 Tax=Tanacetum cinerariifolium TaxID=118510 RepID=A0A6L2LS89_TANCI|nr:hypothetical protein [Tanacetum cinerariifolium]